MFVYKYCPKCSKRNHRANKHCVRCGDQLTVAERFGKDVFAVTLSLIVLFSSASVFASRSYFNNRTNSSTPSIVEATPQEQNSDVQPTQETTPQPVEIPAPTTTTTPTTTPKNNTTPAPTATPTPAPQLIETPTSQPTNATTIPPKNNKICEDQKAIQLSSINSIYDGKVNTENTRHEAELNRIKEDYNNRGLLQSGLYVQAINAENANHEVKLNDIDAWYNYELVKIDQSC